ncbi:peptidoglycan DD-metalloendopeptidase family protein [Aureibacter tunicatorum]|uniref:Murein DD-endopeptidase MepM/ murein hydrolase activator NlpD n=1 Tax=Aureibacter tunicatorum TaxID=866807 RepID=A0AAE3XTD8_9BACT|nr:peptidoglycan DD-metalloendopeptidase family protein [Aureibacter tunicatorum]MDR6241309.1 murein DD-endopeptidase MepM/ murein hydrolase activator NlpD [Aureibacter tunicatorum]BDD03568.1 peptidase [Aureibacter tunicatorum]
MVDGVGIRFLFFILLLAGVTPAYSQKKKKFWDIFKKKDNKAEQTYIESDSAFIDFDEGEFDLAYDSSLQMMVKDHFMELEDITETSAEEEKVLVEVSEQLKIDDVWVNSFQYYSIWNEWSVDPYHMDLKNFSDTLRLPLYDSKKGEHWAYPMKPSKVTSDFGMRNYQWHYGIDLRLNTGDPIYAAFDGIVRMARYNRGGYGYYVVLRHKNGLETIYAHLSKYVVKIGQEVKAGEMIGKGGSTGRSTGPHLHFEVRYNGIAIDPNALFNFEDYVLLRDKMVITPETFAYMKEIRKVVHHRIRSGDTLSRISRRYSTSISKICKLNGISRNTILRVGRKLRVR